MLTWHRLLGLEARLWLEGHLLADELGCLHAAWELLHLVRVRLHHLLHHGMLLLLLLQHKLLCLQLLLLLVLSHQLLVVVGFHLVSLLLGEVDVWVLL